MVGYALDVLATRNGQLPSAAGWSLIATSSSTNDPAQEAFDEAVTLFNEKFTEDEKKRIWLQDKNSISDVQDAVAQAQRQYDAQKQSKARKWLTAFSQRVMLYGVVLDVMVQHHPEYVSLAWGAIKFVFQGVMNQEELIRKLSKALCAIADALPHVELKLVLYPTDKMKALVSRLYAQLIKFILRATNWYTEGKFRHFFTSIGRPYALRFEDLAEDIKDTSREVDRLALTMSQAELRDMSIRQQETLRKLTDFHSIQFSSMLDTSRRVCEIQFSQILTFTATGDLAPPEKSRQYYASMRNRRRRLKGVQNDLFRFSNDLQTWGADPQSSFVYLRGAFATRHTARDFAADAIDLIEKEKIPVVWALTYKDDEDRVYTSLDVLKQIVLQVLQQNHHLLNEKSVALNAARFQSARTEQDWFNLLGAALEGLSQVYVIVDLDVLGEREEGQYPWTHAFATLVDEMQAKNIPTVVKIALISYRAYHEEELPSAFDKVLTLPKKNKPGHRRLKGHLTAKKTRGDVKFYSKSVDMVVVEE